MPVGQPYIEAVYNQVIFSTSNCWHARDAMHLLVYTTYDHSFSELRLSVKRLYGVWRLTAT